MTKADQPFWRDVIAAFDAIEAHPAHNLQVGVDRGDRLATLLYLPDKDAVQITIRHSPQAEQQNPDDIVKGSYG